MAKRKNAVMCPKCGKKNPEEAVFCLKCGSKIRRAEEAPTPLEGLIFLHIVGSMYTILTVIFNTYVRTSVFYLSFYLGSGILGLCAAYALHQQKGKRWAKSLLSLATIAIGVVGTFRLFLVGQLLGELGEILPLAGPAWIIFLATGIKLWLDRHRI